MGFVQVEKGLLLYQLTVHCNIFTLEGIKDKYLEFGVIKDQQCRYAIN